MAWHEVSPQVPRRRGEAWGGLMACTELRYLFWVVSVCYCKSVLEFAPSSADPPLLAGVGGGGGSSTVERLRFDVLSNSTR